MNTIKLKGIVSDFSRGFAIRWQGREPKDHGRKAPSSGIEGTEWYCRYPEAAGLLWLAYEVGSRPDPKQWLVPDHWLVIAMVIIAAFFAYELTLFLLACGVIAVLLNGVAQLPVSVAIIIGAYIIGSQISYGKRSTK